MSKSPSLRRIQADIRELALDPSDQYHAAPLETDMFEWHFTIRGAKGTDFEGGIYHGRILLPPDYPFKPPHIMFLTPSGRFETNTKICLSFSAYHPELWQPAWGIRLILEALISFLPTPADGAIGALDWSAKERQRLAKKSVEWCCPHCGPIKELIPEEKPKEEGQGDDADNKKKSRFAKEIERLQAMQMQQHKKDESDDEKNNGGDDGTGDESKKDQVESNEMNEEERKQPAKNTSGDNTDTTSTGTKVEAGASSEKSPPDNEKDEIEQSTEESQPVAPTPEVEIEGTVGTNAMQEEEEEIVFVHPQSPEHSAEPEAPAMYTHPHQVDTDYPPAVSSGVWWMMDPLLQLIIVVLSAICYILLRKVHALAEEMQSLEP